MAKPHLERRSKRGWREENLCIETQLPGIWATNEISWPESSLNLADILQPTLTAPGSGTLATSTQQFGGPAPGNREVRTCLAGFRRWALYLVPAGPALRPVKINHPPSESKSFSGHRPYQKAGRYFRYAGPGCRSGLLSKEHTHVYIGTTRLVFSDASGKRAFPVSRPVSPS
jgi:hypothetical protein